jgi:hypothetical protein
MHKKKMMQFLADPEHWIKKTLAKSAAVQAKTVPVP